MKKPDILRTAFQTYTVDKQVGEGANSTVYRAHTEEELVFAIKVLDSSKATKKRMLRFENELFDMVISTGMLHMLKAPTKMLGECYRVLKPRGETWIYDPAQVSNKIDKNAWKASFNFKEKLFHKFFTLYARVNLPRTYGRVEMTEMIAETEFSDYQIEENGGDW